METMSVAEYRALMRERRRNKYNARVCVSGDGHRFDSKAERNYYERYLLPLLQAGEISDLELQPKFVLQAEFMDNGDTRRSAITYTADFAFTEASDGRRVVVDVKGRRTEAFSIRWRLALHRYPGLEFRLVEAREWVGA